MGASRPVARAHALRGDGSIFSGLLRGCRFVVCSDRSAAERALAVRRRVYNDECGYQVPIPDDYDGRSWLLLAENTSSGEPVGSMRVTPRWAGRLEAEEYFTLPGDLLSPGLLEVTRFAVVPGRADTGRFVPAVALGLLKLAVRFVRLTRADRVIICSRMDRTHFYTWLGFEPTGLAAPYRKLSNLDHELLTCDLRGIDARCARGHWKVFVEAPHEEIVLPTQVPPLGLAVPLPARPAHKLPPRTMNQRRHGPRREERPFLVSAKKTP